MTLSLHCPTVSILTIDHSGSMAADDYPPTRLDAAREAALEFTREKMRCGRTQDLVGIAAFGCTGSVVLPPTAVQRIRPFESALAGLTVDGGTCFAAGLEAAKSAFEGRSSLGLFDWLLAKPKAAACDPSMQKHVVFLSDGHPADEAPAKRVSQKLKDAGVIIETVGIGGAPSDVGEEILKAMASLDENGNPRYRFIGDRQALLQDFRAKAAMLKVC